MVCLSFVSGSWCCTFKKHYAVLSSNSHIPPPNFELQSQCIWFVVNICGIDLTWQLGFNSGGLSSRVAKTGGNYLQIKVSIAQKLPGRNGWFLHIL